MERSRENLKVVSLEKMGVTLSYLVILLEIGVRPFRGVSITRSEQGYHKSQEYCGL